MVMRGLVHTLANLTPVKESLYPFVCWWNQKLRIREKFSPSRNPVSPYRVITLNELSLQYHKLLSSLQASCKGQSDAAFWGIRHPVYWGVTPLLNASNGIKTCRMNLRLHCAAILERVSETRLIYYDQLRRCCRFPSKLFQP